MKKISKAEANYRPAKSNKRCGNCDMFKKAPMSEKYGRCTLVQGLIDPADTCDFWEKKT